MREDRRQARRFPVLGDQQQATLRVGDNAIAVRLLDQSATGFAIRAEDHPGVFPGEVVWLQTVAGWTECRVVKVRQEVDGTQIGLERIADVAAGPQEVGQVVAEQLAHDIPHTPWPLVGLILALVGVLGFLGWTAVSRSMLSGIGPKHPSVAEEPSAAPPKPAAVRSLEHETTRRASELRKSIQQFGATMLTMPEVVEHLKLTPQQQQRLQTIVQTAAQQERELRKDETTGGDDELEAKSQQLRQAASDAAIEVLDEQQQRQWREMFQAALDQLLPEARKHNNPPQPKEDHSVKQ